MPPPNTRHNAMDTPMVRKSKMLGAGLGPACSSFGESPSGEEFAIGELSAIAGPCRVSRCKKEVLQPNNPDSRSASGAVADGSRGMDAAVEPGGMGKLHVRHHRTRGAYSAKRGHRPVPGL